MSFYIFVVLILYTCFCVQMNVCFDLYVCVNPFKLIYSSRSVLFSMYSTETFVSTATFNLASITVPYATYGCRTRNTPTTVPTVDSVVSAVGRTFVTVKIVACALTNSSSPVIIVRLAST